MSQEEAASQLPYGEYESPFVSPSETFALPTVYMLAHRYKVTPNHSPEALAEAEAILNATGWDPDIDWDPTSREYAKLDRKFRVHPDHLRGGIATIKEEWIKPGSINETLLYHVAPEMRSNWLANFSRRDGFAQAAFVVGGFCEIYRLSSPDEQLELEPSFIQFGFQDIAEAGNFLNGYDQLLKNPVVDTFRFRADVRSNHLQSKGDLPLDWQSIMQREFRLGRATRINAALLHTMYFNLRFPVSDPNRSIVLARLGIDPKIDNLGMGRVNYREISGLHRKELHDIIGYLVDSFGNLNSVTPYMLSERYIK